MRAWTWCVMLIAGAAALSGAACARQPDGKSNGETKSVAAVIARAPSTESLPPTRNEVDTADQSKLTRLEREARALAKRDGCSAIQQCRTAPVGWRACGGPRTYIVYCAATTDTIALFRKLEELKRAEQAYNAESGMMSTCEYRIAPGVKLEGRSCR